MKNGAKIKMINIGLIGMGAIGKIHFDNIMHLQKARLVAVADLSKKSRSLAKAAGVREVYDNYEKLLQNPAIDCVIISVPNFLHADCAIKAAEYGKHMLIEKPLARNVEEGKQIVSKVKKNGIKAMIGYPLRFSQFAKLKKEINSGCLGDVVSCLATHASYGPLYHRIANSHEQTSVPLPVPSWWFEPKLTGGGALIDLGSHMINLLRWFFGDDVSIVKTVLGHRFNMPFEDVALCFIKFKQGTFAIVNTGWYSLKPVTKVELFGVANTVSMSIDYKKKFSVLTSLRERMLGKILAQESPYYKELNYFIDCLISDRMPSPSVEEGLKDLEIISLAYNNAI